MKKSEKNSSLLRALLLSLFWYIGSWALSLPAWITLILHFTIGLPLYWFWATLGAWLLIGLIRFALINFGRWGAENPVQPPKENRNPYSAERDPYAKK